MKKNLMLAFTVLAALSAVACTSLDADDEQDSAIAGLTQMPLTVAEQFYSYRHDMRKCMWPMCGGYWIKSVNKSTTRCADGKSSSECYVAELKNGSELDEYEWSDFLGVPGLLKGMQVQAQDGTTKWITLNVTEAWRAADDVAPMGTFYSVKDNGIRCIMAPCFSLDEIKLNSHSSTKLSGLRGRLSEKAGFAVGEAEIIAAGKNVTTKVSGRRGLELEVNQLYIKQLHVAGLVCATANFVEETNTAYFYAKNFKTYDDAKMWLASSFPTDVYPDALLEIREGVCAAQPDCYTEMWAPQCGTIKDGEAMTYPAPCYFHAAVMHDAGVDQESKGFYTPGECKPTCSLDDLTKNYVGKSPEQCMVIRFACEQGQTYFSDDCGCGCTIKPTCSYNDPSKNYVSKSAEQCMVLFYICKEGQTPFSDDCGCGCQTPL
ncbi:MAG: hypothetical protein MUC50_04480 [Myxococcota bacterium]|jgi:hypothetical protein|nr:hypothetical protein [Myxococcota bacterium]